MTEGTGLTRGIPTVSSLRCEGHLARWRRATAQPTPGLNADRHRCTAPIHLPSSSKSLDAALPLPANELTRLCYHQIMLQANWGSKQVQSHKVSATFRLTAPKSNKRVNPGFRGEWRGSESRQEGQRGWWLGKLGVSSSSWWIYPLAANAS